MTETERAVAKRSGGMMTSAKLNRPFYQRCGNREPHERLLRALPPTQPRERQAGLRKRAAAHRGKVRDRVATVRYCQQETAESREKQNEGVMGSAQADDRPSGEREAGR